MLELATAYLATPIGPLAVSAAAGGVVAVRYAQDIGQSSPSMSACLKQALAELTAYFAGQRTAFSVPLLPLGTPFQRAVWSELAAIPFGRTVTYRDVAAAIGNPAAVRAVGAANGRNPLNILIPCHRVIGADGSLTGYGGGLERKEWLLAHERRVHLAASLAAP